MPQQGKRSFNYRRASYRTGYYRIHPGCNCAIAIGLFFRHRDRFCQRQPTQIRDKMASRKVALSPCAALYGPARTFSLHDFNREQHFQCLVLVHFGVNSGQFFPGIDGSDPVELYHHAIGRKPSENHCFPTSVRPGHLDGADFEVFRIFILSDQLGRQPQQCPLA